MVELISLFFVYMSNCLILLKRMYYVCYNLSHIYLKVTMGFLVELELFFLSFIGVCMCLFLKKQSLALGHFGSSTQE